MKKLARTFVFLAMAATLTGCAGKMYNQQTVLPDGTVLTQGGRTGVFGTDNSFVYIMPEKEKSSPPAPTPEPIQVKAEKVELKRTYTKSVTSWSGCPDKTPNRNAKGVKREEVTENWTEEVLSEPKVIVQAPTPAPAPPQAVFGFGTNSSVGNLTAPVAVAAGGYTAGQALRRPDESTTTNTSSGGTGTGGTATGGTGGTGTGGAGGTGGEASAAASSASESNSDQTQTQDQTLDNDVDIDN